MRCNRGGVIRDREDLLVMGAVIKTRVISDDAGVVNLLVIRPKHPVPKV